MAGQAFERLLKSMAGTVAVQDGQVLVKDKKRLPGRMNGLIYEAVFGDAETKAAARWLIWETAQALGIRPASIHDLYMARGRGDCRCDFTVPAMNLRMLTYDSARAVFRAARKLDAGALTFEIARSEIGYTDQRPSEYVSAILAAAIKEGFRGPVFIQGDHFQVGAKKYAAAPEAELKAIRDLIVEAIGAGFYNIDIDTSTLVDLAKPTLDEQQRLNYELCADLTRFIRHHEPKGVTISVGGEIGEVGHKNSTPEELEAFMRGYNARKGDVAGTSAKSASRPAPATAVLSCQTGRWQMWRLISTRSGQSANWRAENMEWVGQSSMAPALCQKAPLASLLKRAHARFTWPRRSRHSCSSTPQCPEHWLKKCTSGCASTAPTNANLRILMRNSFTRRARRRLAPSRSNSGRCQKTHAAPSALIWKRCLPSCSSN